MRSLKAAIPAPFLVLGFAAVAFVGWLAYDAAYAPASARRTGEAPLPTPEEPFPEPVAASLNTLHTGLPRVVVEQHLTGLLPPQVEPVDVSSGKPVCRQRYTIHLAHPIPKFMPSGTAAFVPGPYTLTVEFDGGAAGHPLTRVMLAPAPLPATYPALPRPRQSHLPTAN